MQISESILVIEDDELLREIVQDTLEDAGYLVTVAADPDAAIALAKSQGFHLVLTDVRMAGSTDGVGAVEQIKKKQPHIRSIIMTGYASDEVPLRAARIQADDYLLKGDTWFGAQELLKVVRRTLDREERSDPGWLARFLAVPGQWAKKGLKALFEAKLAELEQERKNFLQSFYLLLRPGHLNEAQGLRIWARLEEAELSFREMVAPAEIAALRVAYHHLHRSLEDPSVFPPVTMTGLFSSFYRKIREGKIELPQFEQAAVLRMDVRARQESVEAYVLYHWLWSPPKEFDLDGFSGMLVGPYVLRELIQGTARIPGFRSYRATRSDQPQTFLLRVIEANPETRANFPSSNSQSSGVGDVIEAMGALFFVLEWPWTPEKENKQANLRNLLVPGGTTLPMAWELLRPVFAHVVAQHGRGLFCGTLTPEDVFLQADGPPLVLFVPRPWVGERGKAMIVKPLQLAFQPPEWERGELSPASDQFCLATLLLYCLLGEPSPIQFLIHCIRASTGDSPWLPGASFPLWQKSGPAYEAVLQRLEQIVLRMRNADPSKRAPALASAINALDEVSRDLS